MIVPGVDFDTRVGESEKPPLFRSVYDTFAIQKSYTF